MSKYDDNYTTESVIESLEEAKRRLNMANITGVEKSEIENQIDAVIENLDENAQDVEETDDESDDENEDF